MKKDFVVICGLFIIAVTTGVVVVLLITTNNCGKNFSDIKIVSGKIGNINKFIIEKPFSSYVVRDLDKKKIGEFIKKLSFVYTLQYVQNNNSGSLFIGGYEIPKVYYLKLCDTDEIIYTIQKVPSIIGEKYYIKQNNTIILTAEKQFGLFCTNSVILFKDMNNILVGECNIICPSFTTKYMVTNYKGDEYLNVLFGYVSILFNIQPVPEDYV